MSHLTPVHIVDKNGKATTVRRKLAQLFSPKRVIPPPAPAASQSQACLTPLSKPAPLTGEESSGWLDTVNFDTTYQKGLRRTHNAIAMLEPDTQALVKELIEQKNVPTIQVVRLMGAITTVLPEEQKYALSHDIMLVVGKLQEQGRLGDKTDYSGLLISLRDIKASSFGKLPLQRISSQEELEGKTAMTHAMSHLQRNHTLAVTNEITSAKLVELIQDQPEDVDRILAYIDERGMTNDRDFEGLVESLESPAPAIEGGWL